MVSSHRGGSHWWNAAGLESVDNPTTQDGESRGSFAENKTVYRRGHYSSTRFKEAGGI